MCSKQEENSIVAKYYLWFLNAPLGISVLQKHGVGGNGCLWVSLHHNAVCLEALP